MPTHEQHTEQAVHNEKLLAILKQHDKQVEFADWCVTITFYAMVHYFEAILHKAKPEIREPRGRRYKVEHTQNHEERERIMFAMYRDIHMMYNPYYVLSKSAKYRRYKTPPFMAQKSEIDLGEFKKVCERLMS